MIEVTLSQIVLITCGKLVGKDKIISSISTDSRTVGKGGLFVALKGERLDGHDFLSSVAKSGASAALVSRYSKCAEASRLLSLIFVEDTKKAMGRTAAWIHNQCKMLTAAITGSCGKTTVKEMVASILLHRGQVLHTWGNYNNDVGVPLTLLRSAPNHDFAVIELGASRIGEIKYTTSLVKPDIALVNNVDFSHLESFGSIEGVKKAKGEIYQGLESGAVAGVNLDSNGGHWWHSILADKRVKTFSTSSNTADVYAENIGLDANAKARFLLVDEYGKLPVTLNIPGRHNVANALAAALITREMGAKGNDIQRGLLQFSGVGGRVEMRQLMSGVRLIDDSYNASVPAMKSAIELLAHFTGIRWLVLGNMAELGQVSLSLHRQVGEYATLFNFEHILTFGEHTRVVSQVCEGCHFSVYQDLVTYVHKRLSQEKSQQHTILVKGSRSSGISKVATALKESSL